MMFSRSMLTQAGFGLGLGAIDPNMGHAGSTA